MQIAVTGSNGFIGNALAQYLSRKPGDKVLGLTRNPIEKVEQSNITYYAVGHISQYTQWQAAIDGVDVIVHTAARAHAIQENEKDSLNIYRAVNVVGTETLIDQAIECGVKRFVFLSSIGVLGIHTNARKPFTVSDIPNPLEYYSTSKWEAENLLWEKSKISGLEIVIVRPPLVYGPYVKGNFLRLLKLASSGIPLPLNWVHNQRSLIGIDNLVDLLTCCIEHPDAKNQIFLVSDDHDLSTANLLSTLYHALGMKPRLFPAPPSLLRLAGYITKKTKEVDRLIGSLQVDISKTKAILGWTPTVSIDEGLYKTAKWYLGQT